jgi:hypothetical protein
MAPLLCVLWTSICTSRPLITHELIPWKRRAKSKSIRGSRRFPLITASKSIWNTTFSHWNHCLIAEGNCVPVCAVKTYMGSKSIAPLTLTFSTRWKWVVKFTRKPFCFIEGAALGMPIGWVRHRVVLDILEKRNISCICGDSNSWSFTP